MWPFRHREPPKVDEPPPWGPAGSRWDGLAAWFHGPEVDYRPGFYALDGEGRTLLLWQDAPVRLVGVDDAPGDAGDGRWHLEVAGSDDAPQRPASVAGQVVEFEPEPITTGTKVEA